MLNKEEYLIEIGKLIKQARIKAGLSRINVGTALGVDARHIGRWENGKSAINCYQLYKLEKLLKTEIKVTSK